MVVVAVNNANNLESTANANNVRRTAPNKHHWIIPPINHHLQSNQVKIPHGQAVVAVTL